MWPSTPGHRVGDEQGVGDRLLGGVDDGREDVVDRRRRAASLLDHARTHRAAAGSSSRRRRRSRRCRRGRPSRRGRDRGRPAGRRARAVGRRAGCRWRRRRCSDPPSSCVGAVGRSAASAAPTGTPPMRRLAAPPKLASTQHADRAELADAPATTSRCPALWPIVIIPVPAPTTPSATGPAGRGVDGRPHVGGRHPAAGDVVEPGVVALADDGDDDVDHAGGEEGVDDGVVAATDGVGGGQHDRRLEDAPLAHLDRPGQLAGAVEHRHAGRHRPAEQRRHVVGHDRRHTGPGDAVRLVAPHRDVADAARRARR